MRCGSIIRTARKIDVDQLSAGSSNIPGCIPGTWHNAQHNYCIQNCWCLLDIKAISSSNLMKQQSLRTQNCQSLLASHPLVDCIRTNYWDSMRRGTSAKKEPAVLGVWVASTHRPGGSVKGPGITPKNQLLWMEVQLSTKQLYLMGNRHLFISGIAGGIFILWILWISSKSATHSWWISFSLPLMAISACWSSAFIQTNGVAPSWVALLAASWQLEWRHDERLQRISASGKLGIAPIFMEKAKENKITQATCATEPRLVIGELCASMCESCMLMNRIYPTSGVKTQYLK